jgi:outer membrane protein OmpA-like peptidoglycan-associated protein
MNRTLRFGFGALIFTFAYSANADVNIPGILSVKDNGQVSIPGILNIGSNGSVNIPGILHVDSKSANSSSNVVIHKETAVYKPQYQISSGEKRYFRNKDMSRGNFSNQDFSNVTFQNVDGSRSNFSGANFSGAVFINSDFSRANFSGANLSHTRFQNVELSRATLNNTCFPYAKIINSDLSRARLNGAVLIGTDFDNCEMSRVSKKGATYTGVPRCVGVQEQFVSEREILIKSNEIQEALLTKRTIDLTINFEFDSDKIIGEAHKQIFEIAQALKSKKLANSKIQIQGHTDSRGSNDYNMNLSNQRAMSVMRELVYKDGFDSSKFSVKGYGESQPIASNMYEQGRSLNRRVTLVNISK